MKHVTIRELRNEGRAVVDRVLAGESLIVTRSGEPVAELRPVRRRSLKADELLARYRQLPPMDPRKFRDDLDAVLDRSI